MHWKGPVGKNWSLFDLEVPSATRIGYPLHVAFWEPRTPGPLTMDIHQGLELGIVLKGRMERHYEDLAFMAGPGDIHLCSAWEPHGWRVASPNTSQVVLIFLPEIVANDMLRDVPWLSFFTVPPRQRPRAATPELRREILHVGKLIGKESVGQPPGWQAAVRSLLFYILVLLGRHWEPAKRVEQTQVAASSFSRLMPAVDLVHRDPARQTGLEEAAASCGLGRSRFATLFRHTMGVSFGQFRRRAQMARVAHLLLTTDLPTDAVAEAAGFVDGSHLHRVFVQYYGRTPGQYRKDNR